MKLVEILAAEMEEWPEGVTHLTQSNVDREIYNALDGKKESSVDSLNPRFDTRRSHSEGSYPIVTEKQWQAERDRQKGGEWKRHRGGKQPVADDTYIEYKLRDGFKLSRVAGSLDWSHNNGVGDIMQYRVISQPKAEEVDSISEAVHKPIIEALNSMAAEWHEDQIDGPIKWRDTVNELDAYIEKFTREREALINRLALEGFSLLPAMTPVMGVADIDFSDWRNWKAGDVIEVLNSENEGWLDLKGLYGVLSEDSTGLFLSFNGGNRVWYIHDNSEYRFIRRP